MEGAWEYLQSRGDALLASVRALSFEDQKAFRQPVEKLSLGHFCWGGIQTHVHDINEHTIRVVVHGVLGFRLLGNYVVYIKGFRRNSDGTFDELTEADYYEFD